MTRMILKKIGIVVLIALGMGSFTLTSIKASARQGDTKSDRMQPASQSAPAPRAQSALEAPRISADPTPKSASTPSPGSFKADSDPSRLADIPQTKGKVADERNRRRPDPVAAKPLPPPNQKPPPNHPPTRSGPYPYIVYRAEQAGHEQYTGLATVFFKEGSDKSNGLLVASLGQRFVIEYAHILNRLPNSQSVRVSYSSYMPQSIDPLTTTPQAWLDPGQSLTIYATRSATAGNGYVFVYFYGYLTPVPRGINKPL